MNQSLLQLFNFPNCPEQVDTKAQPLKMRMFYEGTSGCLSFEASGTSVKIEGIAFVPEVTDKLIGYSFLTRAEDVAIYYQDIYCGDALIGNWTLVFNKFINRFDLKIYAENYRDFMDLEGKVKPVFVWKGRVCGYMMALKGFMEEWPYQDIDKMSFA